MAGRAGAKRRATAVAQAGRDALGMSRVAAWPGHRPGRHHARRDEAPAGQIAAADLASTQMPRWLVLAL
jgi:hypothetical protein